MNNLYEDILYLPHHVSPTRAQITIAERAAQFSPFAALTGYDAVIRETGRSTVDRIIPTEEELESLNAKFLLLTASSSKDLQVQITYFKPDTLKKGGSYITVSDTIRKIDAFERMIYLRNGMIISMDDLIDIVV